MPEEMNTFEDQLRSYQNTLNGSLLHAFMDEEPCHDLTTEAAMYSLIAGGKRIRPVLMLAVSDMLQVSDADILPFACAIEMIHTYSLIHDDLPCMDNDDTRRGQPTCHVKYSEAMALLAGDALLNRAYEILFEACLDGNSGKLKAAQYLSSMSGIKGMIGGQTMDIICAGKKISEAVLTEMHRKKTGCLLSASIVIPVFLQKIHDPISNLEIRLNRFSEHIGLGFQIKDDLLDVTSTKEILGKNIGKDEAEDKSTFVTLFGMEKAQELLIEEMMQAQYELIQLKSEGYDTGFLENLSQYLLNREK